MRYLDQTRNLITRTVADGLRDRSRGTNPVRLHAHRTVGTVWTVVFYFYPKEERRRVQRIKATNRPNCPNCPCRPLNPTFLSQATLPRIAFRVYGMAYLAAQAQTRALGKLGPASICWWENLRGGSADELIRALPQRDSRVRRPAA
jgi:hypothetical protein